MSWRGVLACGLACVVLAVPAMSGALAVGNPTAKPIPSQIKVWFTDAGDRRITMAALGQVVRIHSNWGRVCVRRTNGPYCANPLRAPSWLERRIGPNLVISERIWATSGDISGP